MANRASPFVELGVTGLNKFSGVMDEEFLRELHGRRGVEVYKEMATDETVGAILFTIEMLMRQAQWDIKGAGTSEADDKAVEFVFSCLHDMDDTWSDFISEVLSFMTYGWSYHEIVYKRRMGSGKSSETRSKHNDGLIGWRKLPIRSQDTLSYWEYDDHDNLVGLVQQAPPTFAQTLIPIQKALHFKTKSKKNNPEGQSLLRTAYKSWYFKRRIQIIEGVGIERDLAGFPTLTPPESAADVWMEDTPESKQMKLDAELMVRNIKRDAMEGALIPPGWKLELLSSGGRRQFDTDKTITRYDTKIAQTLMADFMDLGHEKNGSYALSSDKTELFSVMLGAFLDLICEVFNKQAIPRLIEINGEAFSGITGYPELIHGDVETQNLKELGAYIKDMVAVGAIVPDISLEEHLRRVADLPEREDAGELQGGKSNVPKPAANTPEDEPLDNLEA
jgi:hypothetical protein